MYFLESLAAFRKFLTHEYSEENLDFWLECKEFKLVKDSKYRKVAAKIYDRFIASGSEKEVSRFQPNFLLKSSLFARLVGQKTFLPTFQ